MQNYKDYSYICELADLKNEIGHRFYINDVDIAVFKVNEKIFVVSNTCPHQQAGAIHDGFIEDENVVCPLHGWTFKLCDGRLHNGARGLDAFPSKIIDGKLYSKVAPKNINW